jgi:gamma-glutamylcyclotransferase (GGCT)/AIG2-like uncharacterized protein YtfP
MIRARRGVPGRAALDLFVYGSLMVSEVMHGVCGYTGPGEAALLPGYRRRRLLDQVYPGIRPWPDDTVEGVLYRGLEAAHLHALDRFEGECYRREPVRVRVGRLDAEAQAYVLVPGQAHLMSAEPWSLERFLSDGLRVFLAEYPGFVAAGRVGAEP